MEYRRLGKTDEKVSTIGMGTWNVGKSTDPSEKAEQIRALKRGLELGINLIDTAEIYSAGMSEQLVGEAIRDDRDSAFVASKVSASHLHHDALISACESSLKRLGTSYVDLYQVHWPNPGIPIRETMAAMEQLVRDGKVRYIGVSNFNVEETSAARDALAKSELVSNQVEYSLVTRMVEQEILPYCQEQGITIIAYSPLARGNIPQGRVPKGLLEKYHMTPAQVMLNWVTRNESVVAIPKSAKVGHTEENAGSVSARFTKAEYEQISGAAG